MFVVPLRIFTKITGFRHFLVAMPVHLNAENLMITSHLDLTQLHIAYFNRAGPPIPIEVAHMVGMCTYHYKM